MTPLPDRVKTLIPMLASNNDGEAMNAVRALRRSLSTVGLDLHDLVKSLGSVQVRQMPCAVCAVRAAEVRARAKRAAEVASHTKGLTWLLSQDFRFSEWERGFLENLKAWTGELTEKQSIHFKRILEKVRSAAESEF